MSSSIRIFVLPISILIFIFSFHSVSAQDDKVPEGSISINGTELYYQVVGKGEPIVVLHGGPGLDHSYFLPQFATLGERYKLIFYDQRGCGKSSVDIDSSTVTMDQNVEDLEALRKAFKLEKMNLLGHSFGGLLAMRYAIKYPGHLKSLILVNTTPATSAWRDSSFKLMAQRSDSSDASEQQQLARTDDFKNRKPETMSRFYSLLFRSSFYYPGYADSLNLHFTSNYKETSKLMDNLYLDRSLKTYDLNAGLDSVRCRALIMASAGDFTPPAALGEIQKHLKRSTYVYLEACGHFPWIESPEQFREAIYEFFKTGGF